MLDLMLEFLNYTYDINIQNIYCTKISSKLSRTFTDKHGYKDLCLELLNKKINKNEQTSDWGAKKLIWLNKSMHLLMCFICMN